MVTARTRIDPTSSSVSLDVTDWLQAPIHLPPGLHEFAIGDVHGHMPQFQRLIDAMAARSGGDGHLTLLGDLIDRGPASLECVRLATRTADELGFAGRTLLLGNHEMLMLMALSGRPDAADAQDIWMANGGDMTLGEAGPAPSALALRTEASRAAIERAIGKSALDEISEAALSRQAGNLLFVHAGIDPDVPLEEALDKPPLSLTDGRHPAWIRGPFLDHSGGFEGGRIVVHGHTPEPRVLAGKGRAPRVGWHRLDGSRLGLDGGSYGTGVVAGAEFRRDAYRVFTANGR